ncbi:hypothetical protein CDAR_486051 [Caerostris darwini]|uniref:Uncharacterized protein n=1 Tax=Caerostris darwini TaxID=1538125 RepID=A0AAV4WK85_9ARAC|nr:hypothetical protein CDAR_486051 [Caerostris darwini]
MRLHGNTERVESESVRVPRRFGSSSELGHWATRKSSLQQSRDVFLRAPHNNESHATSLGFEHNSLFGEKQFLQQMQHFLSVSSDALDQRNKKSFLRRSLKPVVLKVRVPTSKSVGLLITGGDTVLPRVHCYAAPTFWYSSLVSPEASSGQLHP